MVVAVLVAAGAGWLAWRATPREPRRSEVDRVFDPLAQLPPARADSIAKRLVGEDRALESLAYYRRALTPPSKVQTHVDYATALRDAAFEGRSVGGLGMPATRSSVERVALMREALAHLDVAEKWVTNEPGRAAIINLRGQFLKSWGFPMLSLAELRRAQRADPASRRLRAEADYYADVMRRPDQVLAEDLEVSEAEP